MSSEQPGDEGDELGPPWTVGEIMVDSLPEDKKRELREKRRQQGAEDVE